MIYSLHKTQLLKTDLETLWTFMKDPRNLARITPSRMDFQIKNAERLKEMHAGQIIEYTIKPLLGIRMTWVTEITHVKENIFFVDEQRFGPYKFWHHQHHYKEVSGGVEMNDIVHFKIGYGIFDSLIYRLIIKKELETIFNYRYNTLETLFDQKLK